MAEVQRKLGDRLRGDLKDVPVFHGAPLPPAQLEQDRIEALVKRFRAKESKSGCA